MSRFKLVFMAVAASIPGIALAGARNKCCWGTYQPGFGSVLSWPLVVFVY
jgi:hypothetical protein